MRSTRILPVDADRPEGGEGILDGPGPGLEAPVRILGFRQQNSRGRFKAGPLSVEGTFPTLGAIRIHT